jgi:hypothetical protein
MTSKNSSALVPGLIFLMSVLAVASFAQTWNPAIAPSTNWSDVVSSADGTRWFASAGAVYSVPVFDDPNYNSPIYCSTNSGLTWQPTLAPQTTWSSIACSADGTHVGAAVGGFGGPIYISQDSGATWNPTQAPSTNWSSIACSAAGDKWIAAGGSVIYTSADYGNTWVSNNIPSKIWTQVASSANGDILFTYEIGYYDSQIKGSIYVSTNSGVNWAPTSFPQQEWNSIACSADGTRVVAGPIENLDFDAAPLYFSSDSGNSWTSNATPTDFWRAVASSADGSKLVAASTYFIYTSADGGNTWTPNNAPQIYWDGLGSSADGSKLAATALNGGLYILQSTPAVRLCLKPSNGEMTLSWVVPSTNLVLQESADLSSWSNVTNTRTLDLNSLQDQVNLSPSGSSGFYRLASP